MRESKNKASALHVLPLLQRSHQAKNLNQTRYNGRPKMDEPARDWRQEGAMSAPQPNSVNHRTNAQQACHSSISNTQKKQLECCLEWLYICQILCIQAHIKAEKRDPCVDKSMAHRGCTPQQRKDFIKPSVLISEFRPDGRVGSERKNRQLRLKTRAQSQTDDRSETKTKTWGLWAPG